MGLDMYLVTTPKLKETFHPELIEWNKVTEVADFRKANAIHRWFVENAQNGIDECKPHVVTKSQIEDVVRKCEDVIALVPKSADIYSNDFSVTEDIKRRASEILPTQEGFFFGPTDYDNWYFEKIHDAKCKLEYVLESVDFDKETLIYQSSW